MINTRQATVELMLSSGVDIDKDHSTSIGKYKTCAPPGIVSGMPRMPVQKGQEEYHLIGYGSS